MLTIIPVADGVFDDALLIQDAIDKVVAAQAGLGTGPRSVDADIELAEPPTGRYWHLKTANSIIGGDSFVTLNITARPMFWAALQVEHGGGHFILSAAKRCTFRGISLLLTASNSIGWDITGDAKRQSESGNRWDNCRVQPVLKALSCTGWRIGVGGNDHCNNSWTDCEFFTSLDLPTTDVYGACKRASLAGHVGWSVKGGNTLALSFVRCNGTGTKVVFDLQSDGKNASGGDNATFTDCGGSFNVLAWRLDGGFTHRMTGGRWENGISLFLHGAALNAGQGLGGVSMAGVKVDGYDTTKAAEFGYVDNGSLCAVNSNGLVKLEQVGGLNKVDLSRWASIRSNKFPGPSVVLVNCYNLNIADPANWKRDTPLIAFVESVAAGSK